MQHMILNPMVSSYLNTNGFLQYMNGSPLFLSNMRTLQGHHCYSLCITITAKDIDFSSTVINQAVLELPIQKLYPYTGRLRNVLRVYTHTNDRLKKSHFSSVLIQPITKASFEDNALQVDITSLMKEWDYKESPILEVILSINSPNLSIQIYNQSTLSTKLIIGYKKQTVATPPPDARSSSMLSVSSTNCACEIIEPNSIIPFDTINDDLSTDITYDTDTNTFSFARTGYYYAEWILNIRGSTTIDFLAIGIRNESTGSVLDFHTPSMFPVQLCGQHIMHVTDTSVNYSLINACDSPIQLSRAYTQASLIIFKL